MNTPAIRQRLLRSALAALLALPGLAPAADGLVPAKAEEFAKLVDAGAKLEKLAGDLKFLEGPAWCDAGGYLVFSDIPANQIRKWSAKEGLGTFREDSRNANGNAYDAEGRLVTCEHSGRRLSRTAADGTVTTLVDSYQGKKLSSPNDLAIRSDGTIWFTDPPYGIPKGEAQEQAANHVFRFDPATKAISVVASDFDRPNGIAFSPDEKLVYITDTGKQKQIRVFTVGADGTLSGGKVFVDIDKGGPDGIRVDAQGDVWSSAGDGVRIYSPSGELIGTILVPESPSNLCFGGADHHTLFITARKSLYAIPVKVGPAK